MFRKVEALFGTMKKRAMGIGILMASKAWDFVLILGKCPFVWKLVLKFET